MIFEAAKSSLCKIWHNWDYSVCKISNDLQKKDSKAYVTFLSTFDKCKVAYSLFMFW